MKLSLVRLVIGLGALLLLSPLTGWAAGGAAGLKSDSKVKVAVKAQKSAADNSETVSITLMIDKGWHVYANPVALEDLASSQTSVTIEGSPKPEVVKIDYPLGKLVKDSVVGDHKIYEDQVTIKVQVRRGEASPMTVAVKFQACSEKACLQAATVKTVLP